jgi:hypothetical protein
MDHPADHAAAQRQKTATKTHHKIVAKSAICAHIAQPREMPARPGCAGWYLVYEYWN